MSRFENMYMRRNFDFDMYFDEYGNETLSADVISEVKRGIGQMFYIVDREEMTFEDPEDVPNIFQQLLWSFTVSGMIWPNSVSCETYNTSYYPYSLSHPPDGYMGGGDAE